MAINSIVHLECPEVREESEGEELEELGLPHVWWHSSAWRKAVASYCWLQHHGVVGLDVLIVCTLSTWPLVRARE